MAPMEIGTPGCVTDLQFDPAAPAVELDRALAVGQVDAVADAQRVADRSPFFSRNWVRPVGSRE